MRTILVCFASPLEGEGLPAAATGCTLRLVETGVGPVNAAHAVTRALLDTRADAIIVCGIGGAYPSSGLEIGDIVCASTETYGDMGADSPDGFLDMRALGFPLIPAPSTGDAPALYDALPLDLFPAARRVPFVTNMTVTGTDARAEEMTRRTGGAVESMEGAAIVQVARMMGVPVGEVRGISNIAAHRDRERWRLHEAAAAARQALLAWIEETGGAGC